MIEDSSYCSLGTLPYDIIDHYLGFLGLKELDTLRYLNHEYGGKIKSHLQLVTHLIVDQVTDPTIVLLRHTRNLRRLHFKGAGWRSSQNQTGLLGYDSGKERPFRRFQLLIAQVIQSNSSFLQRVNFYQSGPCCNPLILLHLSMCPDLRKVQLGGYEKGIGGSAQLFGKFGERLLESAHLRLEELELDMTWSTKTLLFSREKQEELLGFSFPKLVSLQISKLGIPLDCVKLECFNLITLDLGISAPSFDLEGFTNSINQLRQLRLLCVYIDNSHIIYDRNQVYIWKLPVVGSVYFQGTNSILGQVRICVDSLELRELALDQLHLDDLLPSLLLERLRIGTIVEMNESVLVTKCPNIRNFYCEGSCVRLPILIKGWRRLVQLSVSPLSTDECCNNFPTTLTSLHLHPGQQPDLQGDVLLSDSVLPHLVSLMTSGSILTSFKTSAPCQVSLEGNSVYCSDLATMLTESFPLICKLSLKSAPYCLFPQVVTSKLPSLKTLEITNYHAWREEYINMIHVFHTFPNCEHLAFHGGVPVMVLTELAAAASSQLKFLQISFTGPCAVRDILQEFEVLFVACSNLKGLWLPTSIPGHSDRVFREKFLELALVYNVQITFRSIT